MAQYLHYIYLVIYGLNSLSRITYQLKQIMSVRFSFNRTQNALGPFHQYIARLIVARRAEGYPVDRYPAVAIGAGDAGLIDAYDGGTIMVGCE